MNYKIDFHTHSTASYDGGLTILDYTKIFQQGILNFVAVTDHNTIFLAKELQKKFGKKIIVGEEIETLDGEIIGLFLQKEIHPKLTAKETIRQIHLQNGLVYIPHPFEIGRKSVSKKVFKQLGQEVDICEIFNGRSLGRIKEKSIFSSLECKIFASSSDAHCILGIGKTYTEIEDIPTRQNLISLLKNANLEKKYAPLISYLCPFINKLKKRLML